MSADQTQQFALSRKQREALAHLTQAMKTANSTGLLLRLSTDDSRLEALNQLYEHFTQMTPAPIRHITSVCSDFADHSISGVGANAALRAMLSHWEDHLLQGSDPKIICGDINDLMQRLSVMRDEVMRLVAEDAAKPQDESAPAP
jgi:hypothetical protein